MSNSVLFEFAFPFKEWGWTWFCVYKGHFQVFFHPSLGHSVCIRNISPLQHRLQLLFPICHFAQALIFVIDPTHTSSCPRSWACLSSYQVYCVSYRSVLFFPHIDGAHFYLFAICMGSYLLLRILIYCFFLSEGSWFLILVLFILFPWILLVLPYHHIVYK